MTAQILGDRTLGGVSPGPGGSAASQLPLSWLLSVIPFGWRFTQPDRLVVATLISAGAFACLVWRGVARKDYSVNWLGHPGVKVSLFIAALCIAMPALGVSTPYRMPGSILDLKTSAGRPLTAMVDNSLALTPCSSGLGQRGVSVSGAPVLERYVWPFLPLEYTLLPAVPKVLAELADDPEPMAIMEVGGNVHFLSAYFQTFHGKGIGGFYVPDHLRGGGQSSSLTLAEEEIQLQSYAPLAWQRLMDLKVRYIIRFKGDNPDPVASWCPDPSKVRRALEALSASYLQLVHTDDVIDVWKVNTESQFPTG